MARSWAAAWVLMAPVVIIATPTIRRLSLALTRGEAEAIDRDHRGASLNSAISSSVVATAEHQRKGTGIGISYCGTRTANGQVPI